MTVDPFKPEIELDFFNYFFLEQTFYTMLRTVRNKICVEYAMDDQLTQFNIVSQADKDEKSTKQIVDMLSDERNDFLERQDSHYNWEKVFKEIPQCKFGLVPSLIKLFDFSVGQISDTQVLDYMVAYASL